MNKIIDLLKKNIRVILIILVVIGGVGFMARPKNTPQDDLSIPTVDSIQEEVKGTGSVNATGVIEVYSPSKGIIKKMYIKDGDYVESGAKLFEVTSTATEQERATAWAALALAKSNLKIAETSKVTYSSDLEDARKAILDSANDLDVLKENISNNKNNPSTGKPYTEAEKLAIESALTSARTNFSALEKKYLSGDDLISSSKAALGQASVAYQATRDSVTKSPIAGNVFNLRKNAGDKVGVITDGEPVLVLANTNLLKISFQVSEFSVDKVKIGQEVEITFDAIAGLKVKGVVDGVDTIGNQSLGTVTYTVTILMKPTAEQILRIRPSMTANISILTQKKDNVLVIPRSSVKTEDGKYFVVVNQGTKNTEKEIKVGIIGSDKIEVKDGLSETDKILKLFELK
jgi:HlyD family secretion protein